jgi:hypothetical protein
MTGFQLHESAATYQSYSALGRHPAGRAPQPRRDSL